MIKDTGDLREFLSRRYAEDILNSPLAKYDLLPLVTQENSVGWWMTLVQSKDFRSFSDLVKKTDSASDFSMYFKGKPWFYLGHIPNSFNIKDITTYADMFIKNFANKIDTFYRNLAQVCPIFCNDSRDPVSLEFRDLCWHLTADDSISDMKMKLYLAQKRPTVTAIKPELLGVHLNGSSTSTKFYGYVPSGWAKDSLYYDHLFSCREDSVIRFLFQDVSWWPGITTKKKLLTDLTDSFNLRCEIDFRVRFVMALLEKITCTDKKQLNNTIYNFLTRTEWASLPLWPYDELMEKFKPYLTK